MQTGLSIEESARGSIRYPEDGRNHGHKKMLIRKSPTPSERQLRSRPWPATRQIRQGSKGQAADRPRWSFLRLKTETAEHLTSSKGRHVQSSAVQVLDDPFLS
jgi:hypothetical protein